ncbi:thioredoxin [Deinococcus psychrotolerans]|uniref:Thioredoxin n=1 Tax=Deinococcus psychrotolerans TaxID=2489213 RepID=A0A3G8YG48_9DEIO|nr:thioredoxin family protein [Deinococcus psychrotolerans]AZI44272.1 thioredoxin [Deinococcus psychrotolerans]
MKKLTVNWLSAATLLALTPAALAAEAPKVGVYESYSQVAFDAAKDQQRVLFFAASWCPNCRAADADIMAKLSQIPAKVVIFKTDYDKELALKKKYGITAQHTFVLVDADGKALKKWAGGGLKQIISKTEQTAPAQ